METKNNSFFYRLKSMLFVDFRRMFTSPFFYIMIGITFVMPILILVMTTMMDGSVSVNPQTGVETVIEGFDNVWQIIGASGNNGMSMDLISMCNINMLFFVIAVFVCVFIGADFKSGYSKNLFTVRAKRDDYVISKTIVCFVSSSFMFISFFVGAMLGGVFSGLPFTLEGVTTFNVVMSLLSKIFLAGLFASIYILASVISKSKLWLSILLSLGIGMLFFTIAPVISPLNSNLINVVICLIGNIIFSVGIGFVSLKVLNKTSLV